MSQWGAKGAAEKGLSWQQILDFYYPGTTLARLDRPGTMRVLISGNRADYLRVSAMTGLAVRDLGNGRTIRLDAPRADRWEMRLNRNNGVEVWFHDSAGWHRKLLLAGDGEFRGAPALTLWKNGVTPSRYRGWLRTARIGGGEMRTINVVSLEDYVRGVTPSEMPASWSPHAVRAQVVAARTYALRHRSQNPRRYYHVDDTTAYQVYGGEEAEQPASNDAVRATALSVLMYGGNPALTEFSSSSGGLTAGSSLPYQVVKADPYDAVSGNPNHDWATGMDVGRLERRYGLGDLQRVEATERGGCGESRCDWQGRVENLRLVGTSRTVTVTGNDLRAEYGFRSTWFTFAPTDIIRRWSNQPAFRSRVGQPEAAERGMADGVVQPFEHARVYHSPNTVTREVHGAILARYQSMGEARSVLGFPESDERHGSREGSHVSFFEGGRIYHSRATGAHEVHGLILVKYLDLGADSSMLGLPVRDERAAGARGRVSVFQGGRIYHRRDLGQHEVHGLIERKFLDLGGEESVLGLPVADEEAAAGGGRLSRFQGGRIYHRSDLGQHEVHGLIERKYAAIGADSSALGLPTTDEYAWQDGRRNDFEHGYIYRNTRARTTTVVVE